MKARGHSGSPARCRSRQRSLKPQRHNARAPSSSPPNGGTVPLPDQPSGLGNTAPWVVRHRSLGISAHSVVWLITLATMAFRAHYVTQDKAWWILHPDELYQSLEVAHSEVYGYGFRTYEFLPPAEKDDPSLYYQRERQLGMYALRSPLYPRFYIAVTWLVSITGGDFHPCLVWKLAHVVVSSLLPLAAGAFTRSVFRCPESGAVAAMLTACSVHTNVIGTHTLIHSFLAPFLFIALTGIIAELDQGENSDLSSGGATRPSVTSSGQGEDSYHQLSGDARTFSEAEDKGAVCKTSSVPTQPCVNRTRAQAEKDDSRLSVSGKQFLHKKGNFDSEDREFDRTSEVRGPQSELQAPAAANVWLCLWRRTFCWTFSEYFVPILKGLVPLNFTRVRESYKKIQVCSFLIKPYVCSSARQSLTSGPPRSAESPPRLAEGGRTIEKEASSPVASSERTSITSRDVSVLKIATCAFVMSLCCYLRPDCTLLLLAVCLLASRSHIRSVVTSRRRLSAAVAGCLAGALVGVCDDMHFYSSALITPFNWFWFNVLSGVQSDLFGTDSVILYVNELLWKNAGMCLLLGINVTALTLAILLPQTGTDRFRTAQTYKLFACFLGVLLPFSFQKHKEVRFIHNAMVLYFCLSGANLISVARRLPKRPSSRFSSVAMVMLFFAASQWCDFPSPSDLSAKTWTYRESLDSYDVTQCIRFISRQSDVRGVFINRHLHTFDGYTMLRHNVPILIRTFNGYLEYGLSARTNKTSRNWFGSTKDVSLTTSSKVSNYFSDLNKPYLLLHLIARREYNYLVLDTETDFLEVGYKQVYVQGSAKVLRRSSTNAEEKKLSNQLPGLQSTPRAEVLEKEAQQLFAFGLKKLADERYRQAQEIKRTK